MGHLGKALLGGGLLCLLGEFLMAQAVAQLPTGRYPQYGSRCFADLPQFIASLLVGGVTSPLGPVALAGRPPSYRHVVFLFIDAFGWHFFERYQDRLPFLGRFVREGSVTRLTAQFPSTTSAHVTTLFTGLPVAQHGIFEWHIYEPVLDAMITPLMFSFAGDKEPGTLRATGVSPQAILPEASFLWQLQSLGVTTTAFLHQSYAQSPYNSAVSEGATVIPYRTLPEALVNLGLRLARQDAPSFNVLYFDQIDAICHGYGPDSSQVAAEIDSCFAALERWLRQDMAGCPPHTVLLLVADHGQMAVDPKTTIYLNQLPQFERLRPLLRTDGQGKLLIPGGSPRDLFLYVEEPWLDEAHGLLTSLLANEAEVYRVADLIDQGLFGPGPPSERFLARVGNLVILPRQGQCVWWHEKDRFEQKFYGHHGGLSAVEMEIPLLLLPLA
jgi:predicted AlkP superfamily pyrophosphatase or phosphodiesterase